MKRHLPGLHQSAQGGTEVPEGAYLASVRRANYRWHPEKPFYVVRLAVLEPHWCAGQTVSGRLYCTPRAFWKLAWFLRDFGYDAELLEQDQIDESALVGLTGVVRVSYASVNGRSFLNLEGFAPAGRWAELSQEPVASGLQEMSDDL